MTEITVQEIEAAINGDFCLLFLDGRNEHGSHVLPSFPRSFAINEDDVSEQAEAILTEAEAKGFIVGEDHVWAEFAWQPPQIGDEGRVELDGYWDFRSINAPMSKIISERGFA